MQWIFVIFLVNVNVALVRGHVNICIGGRGGGIVKRCEEDELLRKEGRISENAIICI